MLQGYISYQLCLLRQASLILLLILRAVRKPEVLNLGAQHALHSLCYEHEKLNCSAC